MTGSEEGERDLEAPSDVLSDGGGGRSEDGTPLGKQNSPSALRSFVLSGGYSKRVTAEDWPSSESSTKGKSLPTIANACASGPVGQLLTSLSFLVES